MKINNKEYFVTDENNGYIYEIVYENDDEDVGNKIGKIKNGTVKFFK